jgi:hypothetical protein
MAGTRPAMNEINFSRRIERIEAWMAGTRPAMNEVGVGA